MKCSARGDSKTDQQIGQTDCTNPIGLLPGGRLARLFVIARIARIGRLPVRTELLSLHVEQLRLRDRASRARTAWRRREIFRAWAGSPQIDWIFVGRDASAA